MNFKDNIKILFISHFYPNHDKPFRGTFLHKWAKQLVKNGCDIKVLDINAITLGTYLRSLRDVLNFYKKPKVYNYKWDGLTINCLSIHLCFPANIALGTKLNYILAYSSLIPWIGNVYKEFQFDLIYLSACGVLYLAVSRICRELGIPYISSAIGGDVNTCFDKPDSFKYKQVKEIFVNSSMVVCVSEDINKKVKQITNGLAKTMTYYAGVDTKYFYKNIELRKQYREKYSFSEQDVVLLFIGNMIESKGIYELFDIYKILLEKNKGLKMLMVGNVVEDRKIRNDIQGNGLNNKVIFTGGIKQEEVVGCLNAGDIFVFPSWTEGLPNAVMEACACELPVVASKVGGIPEIIEDGVSGFLFQPKNKEALYTKLLKVIELHESGATCFVGKIARNKILKDFNYDFNGEILVEKVKEIVANQIHNESAC